MFETWLCILQQDMYHTHTHSHLVQLVRHCLLLAIRDVQDLTRVSSSQDLKDYMRKAGEITFADAHKHRRYEG